MIRIELPSRNELWSKLAGFDKAKVALIGDLCLDMYLTADMRLSELSREAPHFPLPVVEERYSSGGAANVAANMAALKPGKLAVIGLIGKDWRGELLSRVLHEAGVDSPTLITNSNITTNTYLKIYRRGISAIVYEEPRIDFENRTPIPKAAEEALCEALDQVDYDVLTVSDQLRFGVITQKVRNKICRMATNGKTVVVDSRDRIHLYPGCIVKPNEIEALRAFGKQGLSLPGNREDMAAFAANLLPSVTEKTGAPALITLGDCGCVIYDEKIVYCPPNRVHGETDIVGAGDTFLSALSTGMASGLQLAEAAAVASYASSVTVKKIGTTGTANRSEILLSAKE